MSATRDPNRAVGVKILILGGTGMIGSGVLMEALRDHRVTSVVAVGRRPTGRDHPKLEEILHADLFDLSPIGDRLTGVDACLFTVGVSAAGMSEEEYHRLTFDMTVTVAKYLLTLNPGITFCYVSGQGTDSTEKGRWMWARVKGKLENELLSMPFDAAYMFRPGYIQPMKGVRSRTRLYAAMYAVTTPLYPLLRRLFPGGVTDSVTLGRAMLRAVVDGSDERVLESADINRLGRATP